MGRVFEKRKHKMFKRYGQMARQFTRVGKEIAIAVKAGGGNPDTNARLRICIQNAKAVSMPKDRVDAAIEKASGKADTSHYHEVIYEGKGPFGIGLIVETATDNPTRTVSNLRVHFNRNGGELGNSGSQSFNFEHKGVFRISTVGLDMDDVELNLIDAGLDNIKLRGSNKMNLQLIPIRNQLLLGLRGNLLRKLFLLQ